MELYVQHLKPNGVLVVNISNVSLDLSPLAFRLALDREGLIRPPSADEAGLRRGQIDERLFALNILIARSWGRIEASRDLLHRVARLPEFRRRQVAQVTVEDEWRHRSAHLESRGLLRSDLFVVRERESADDGNQRDEQRQCAPGRGQRDTGCGSSSFSTGTAATTSCR